MFMTITDLINYYLSVPRSTALLYMYTLLPWLWHLLGAEPAGRKSGIVDLLQLYRSRQYRYYG
jgi:hypothetical protein